MKEPFAVSSPSSLAAPSSLSPRAVSRPVLIVLAAGSLAIVAVVGGAWGAYSSWNSSGQIAPAVIIAGEPVGGLSRAEAVTRLEQRFANPRLTLKAGEKSYTFALASLGGAPQIEETVDKAMKVGRDSWFGANLWRVYASGSDGHRFGLPVKWNRGALTSQIQIADRSFARPARDARLEFAETGLRVESEEAGRALDVSATADRVEKGYWIGLNQIEGATQSVAPKITALDLSGRDHKLGEYRTRFNAGLRGRTTNIRVACRAIDGMVLMPGDSFSFNEATGQRTWEKGYRMAHIFERQPGETESQVVDGLAGGVCQVSSTLYNAVRKSNQALDTEKIAIAERHSHSLPVNYVPRGLDATVAWPSLDFKFRNTLSHPIFLRTHVEGSRLRIEVWGRLQS